MPKEVLRTGATPAPAEPAAAPAAAAPVEKTAKQQMLDTMEAQLKGMALDQALIDNALKTAGAKWDAEHPVQKAAPAEVVTPPAEIKKVAPVKKPAPAEKVVTPAKPAETAEEAELRQRAIDDGHEPDPNAPADEESPGEAPDDDVSDHEGQVVVQNHWSAQSDGALSGPIDASDFKIPQLKLVQGSGPLSKRFNQGTLIYMDQVIFETPPADKAGPPLNFIPVSLNKYFRENIKRPDPEPAGYVAPQPRNANTPEEVAKLGGTTEFTNDQGGNRLKPSWSAAARIMLLIERPEGCEHPGFAIAIETAGKVRYFAPAVMYVNGGQYRSFAKPIIDATNFILCDGTGPSRKIILEKRVWKMQVVKEQSGQNMVFNPKIEMIQEMTPPPLREMAMTMRGKSSKVEAES